MDYEGGGVTQGTFTGASYISDSKNKPSIINNITSFFSFSQDELNVFQNEVLSQLQGRVSQEFFQEGSVIIETMVKMVADCPMPNKWKITRAQTFHQSNLNYSGQNLQFIDLVNGDMLFIHPYLSFVSYYLILEYERGLMLKEVDLTDFQKKIPYCEVFIQHADQLFHDFQEYQKQYSKNREAALKDRIIEMQQYLENRKLEI